MGNRQREWAHEAQAQFEFALVVHALHAPAVPRWSQRQILGHGERVNVTGSPATPPNSRMGQVRVSERPPALRRPGRNSGPPKGAEEVKAEKAPFQPLAKSPPSDC